MLSMLLKKSADNILKCSSYFSQKTDFDGDNLHEMSNLFSEKKKQNKK